MFRPRQLDAKDISNDCAVNERFFRPLIADRQQKGSRLRASLEHHDEVIIGIASRAAALMVAIEPLLNAGLDRSQLVAERFLRRGVCRQASEGVRRRLDEAQG